LGRQLEYSLLTLLQSLAIDAFMVEQYARSRGGFGSISMAQPEFGGGAP
jgi:hypothetical protein